MSHLPKQWIDDKTISDSEGLWRHIITEIQAKIPREMGYAIARDPQPENPAHALICGRITKMHAREMAKRAKLLIPDSGKSQ